MKILILLCFTMIYFVYPTLAQHTISTTDEVGTTAVFGENTDATSTASIGVAGRGHTGVFGIGLGASGAGVIGQSAGPIGVYGLQSSNAGTLPGVLGVSNSTQADASGIRGEISSTTPGINSAGVRGINKGTGTSGIGVYGTHDGTGWGVYGLSNGIGVRGQSAAGTGVYGIHNGLNGTSPGVHGRTSSVEAGAVAILGEVTSSLSGAASTAIVGVNEGTTNVGNGVLGEHMGDGSGVTGAAHGSSGVGVTGLGPAFDFYAAGPGTDYGSASSRRWKKNVINIPDALTKVAQLRGVLFDWDEAHGGKPGMGFIAEEVGAVFPDIVQYEENGVDAIGLDYSKITPVLVEAINSMRKEYLRLFEEQNRLIAQQKEMITELNVKLQKSKYQAAGR